MTMLVRLHVHVKPVVFATGVFLEGFASRFLFWGRHGALFSLITIRAGAALPAKRFKRSKLQGRCSEVLWAGLP